MRLQRSTEVQGLHNGQGRVAAPFGGAATGALTSRSSFNWPQCNRKAPSSGWSLPPPGQLPWWPKSDAISLSRLGIYRSTCATRRCSDGSARPQIAAAINEFSRCGFAPRADIREIETAPHELSWNRARQTRRLGINGIELQWNSKGGLYRDQRNLAENAIWP